MLLDTTVYLDDLHKLVPTRVTELLRSRICNHSAVCLAELTHSFGRLDPAHQGTRAALTALQSLVTRLIHPHRLHAPDDSEWGSAGILAGLTFRLRALPKDRGHEYALRNDSLIYLQASKLGCAVLTRNVEDFDLLNQLVPAGKILLYRQVTA